MPKPAALEHFRYVGDKRTQIVYDMELMDRDPHVAEKVADIVRTAQFLTFGPDTLVEARNRCYRPDASIRRAEAASAG